MRDLIVANEDFGKVIFTNLLETNRPFPSYVVPLFQNDSSRKTFHM